MYPHLLWVQPVRQLFTHHILSLSSCMLDVLCGGVLWGTVSKALLKSKKITPSVFPCSTRWVKFIKKDFPLINLFWLWPMTAFSFKYSSLTPRIIILKKLELKWSLWTKEKRNKTWDKPPEPILPSMFMRDLKNFRSKDFASSVQLFNSSHTLHMPLSWMKEVSVKRAVSRVNRWKWRSGTDLNCLTSCLSKAAARTKHSLLMGSNSELQDSSSRLVNPSAQAESARAGCPGLCPLGFWVFPRRETTQPLLSNPFQSSTSLTAKKGFPYVQMEF